MAERSTFQLDRVRSESSNIVDDAVQKLLRKFVANRVVEAKAAKRCPYGTSERQVLALVERNCCAHSVVRQPRQLSIQIICGVRMQSEERAFVEKVIILCRFKGVDADLIALTKW